MLTKMSFKNFKAWKSSGEIRLAPLTVLFGANSAGKTSIPQLLLMLKQTAESSDRQRPLQFGDARTLVDLGTYDDVMHNHDLSQKLEFSLEWTLADSLEVSDPLTEAAFTGDTLRFHAALVADKQRQPVVESFRYDLKEKQRPRVDLGLERREPTSETAKKSKFDLASDTYGPKRHTGRAWPLPEPFRFYGFPDEATAYFQNTAFAADLVLELERMLRSVYYVGPLREYPKRLYLWSGEVPDHVGERGDRAIEAILAAGARAFNWKPGEKTKPLPTLVAERLRSMGLIQEFAVTALGEHRKEYEVLVRTGAKRPQVKLTDVGFGVSQVLPVIVECFYVPRRSIVIFEQPEIHLHPRVQAELADLFIDAVKARENGKPRDCQFIIESHSEHFLRRLQRRIAEEEITKDDTALYFVHTTNAGARLEELEVNEYGGIANWPDGFFGDEMEDLVARSEAQATRMAGVRKK